MKKRNKDSEAIDARSELEKIKKNISARKKRTSWSKSKLQKHHAELVQLRLAGASYGQLVFWLKAHRMSAARTTVRSFLLSLGIEKSNGENHGAI